MAYVNDNELLNLERTRQNAVNDLRSKNILIDTDADINEAYEKYKSLNNSAQLLDGSATVIRDDNIASVKNYACSYMPNLEKVYFKNATSIGDNLILNSNKIEHIEAPNATYVGRLIYMNTGSYGNLKTFYFPKMLSGFGTDMYKGQSNSLLKKIITPLANYSFNAVFQQKSANFQPQIIDCSITTFNTPTNATFPNLEALILRGNTLPTLAATTFFTNTNLKIYIKSEFVEDLKEATNWSALPCMANEDAVVALETSEYASERWFEQTDEFKLNYIYQDLDGESEEINNE